MFSITDILEVNHVVRGVGVRERPPHLLGKPLKLTDKIRYTEIWESQNKEHGKCHLEWRGCRPLSI
jgi:hypothetical protein